MMTDEGNILPPDPFLPGDTAALGQSMYGLFASLVQGGFPEAYALDIVKSMLVALMLNAAQQPSQGDN